MQDHLDIFGGLPDRDEAAVDPRDLADLARDEAGEHGLGPVVCGACGWRQAYDLEGWDRHDDCERCGESPASIAETAADHEATQRADRYC